MIAFELIKKLFARGVKAADLREQMSSLDREKTSLRYDQRGLDGRRAECFERTKGARKRGDMTEVMFHLQELKGLDTENKLLLRELGRINKALLVLGHYARRLERLERNKDYARIGAFIERFRTGEAMAKIEEANVSEEMFQDILDEELAAIDQELGISDVSTLDDSMKEMLDAVDAVIEAERSGDEGTVRRIRESLMIVPGVSENAGATAPVSEKAAAEAPAVEQQGTGSGRGAGDSGG